MIRVRTVVLAGLVVALIAAGVVALTATSIATSTFRVTRGTIVDGYFAEDFNLAGDVRVTPENFEHEPARDEPAVARQIWATSQIDGFTPEGLGYGDVTISRNLGGSSREQHEAAWVGLAYFNPTSYECTATQENVQAAPPEPRAAGWVAVVVGDASVAPAVLVMAPSVVCGRVRHASLVQATDLVSVPWTDTASDASNGVVATVPECATMDGVGYGGSPTSSTGVVYVTVPEAEIRSRCSGARSVAVGGSALDGAHSSTTHAPLGLVRQAITTSAFPAVPPKCRASQVQTSVTVRRDNLAHGAGFHAAIYFTNQSKSCWMVAGVALVRAFRGTSHVGIGPMSAIPTFFRPEWVVLRRGAAARASIGERSSNCTVARADGLELLSYLPGWANRYFELSPELRVCVRGGETFTLSQVALVVGRDR